MKKLIYALPVLAMLSCGESEEAKQKRLSNELMKNINAAQDKLANDTSELNRKIKLEKAGQN